MKPVIIDVRQPEEYARGHVAGAINMPPDELMKVGHATTALDDVAKDAPIILYCLSGSRSRVSQTFLDVAGYTNVKNGINQDHVEAYLKSL